MVTTKQIEAFKRLSSLAKLMFISAYPKLAIEILKAIKEQEEREEEILEWEDDAEDAQYGE